MTIEDDFMDYDRRLKALGVVAKPVDYFKAGYLFGAVKKDEPVDWRSVIRTIKRTHKWPRKTIAAKVGAAVSTLHDWQAGRCEPRYSQGAALLRLAGHVPHP
jgi:hypothetical protein